MVRSAVVSGGIHVGKPCWDPELGVPGGPPAVLCAKNVGACPVGHLQYMLNVGACPVGHPAAAAD